VAGRYDIDGFRRLMSGGGAMEAIRFDGQVALVTGAGGGIGRAIALELGRRGARLLVNDSGGSVEGAGGSGAPAEKTAAELRALGVTAIANATAVGTAAAAREIVAAALQAYGRIDVLANVAGTALPGEITDFDDAVVEQHFHCNLLGPYMLVRAAWPVMKSQRYGRILNTSSNAALGIGANGPYAATRAGVLGLTLDAAVEGREHGILVNAIMPSAFSRMIAQIPDPVFVDWFRRNLPPEKVAAAAAYLLSAHNRTSGRILAVGGGRVARIAFAEGAGWMDPGITAESAAEHFVRATDMGAPTVLDYQVDEMSLLSAAFSRTAEGPIPVLDRAAVVGAGRAPGVKHEG
jgi:NAD(P)-dependent dehydrogenase (short-subunit alcohol dehydrogenase family)